MMPTLVDLDRIKDPRTQGRLAELREECSSGAGSVAEDLAMDLLDTHAGSQDPTPDDAWNLIDQVMDEGGAR